MTAVITNIKLPIGKASWFRISRFYYKRNLRCSFTVSFYEGEPGSHGSSTAQLCDKKRVVLAFREVNEETIISEIIARVLFDSEGEAVKITKHKSPCLKSLNFRL